MPADSPSRLAGPLPTEIAFSGLVLVRPIFEPAALLGLGVPLFLVTMASQNLPGFAVLRASGYRAVPTRSILAVTGTASLASALFGAHTSNLAAISAALCTGPDTHPDPAKRWLAGPFYGFVYLLMAVFSAPLIAIIAALPSELDRDRRRPRPDGSPRRRPDDGDGGRRTSALPPSSPSP